MKTIINNDWKFTRVWSQEFLEDTSDSEVVRIPHTVQELPLHQINPEDYQGIVGYRKTIEIQEVEQHRFFVFFEGCAHVADIYMNGNLCGHHACGYTGFEVELTDYVHKGKNDLVVKLDTTEQSNIPPFGNVIDYLTYGGIYRNVYFLQRPMEYIEDVFVSTPNLHTLKVDVKRTNPTQQYRVKVMKGTDCLLDEEVSKCENEFHISNAKPWSPEDPQLYQCIVTTQQDTFETNFGFRTIEINETNFLLNGKEYFIRGLNRHQSFPYIGYAATDSLQVEDARILKEELHVNSVRTSHYPQAQSFLDACDRLGLLVFTEIPGWQHIGNEEWKLQAIENAREMVLQNRNHVSIYLWGVRINESLDDDDFYQRTNEVVHQLDPTRPTSGVRYLEKSSLLEDVYSYNDFSHTGKNPGVKKKKDVMKETNHPLLVSESNGHMFPTKPWDRIERLQEHALRHARVMNDAMQDHQHAGVYQWCMFDYATHKDFGSGDRVCYHGVLDSFRNPKPAAHVYASQSEDEPILEVCSSMDIGDYDGGHLHTVSLFTNADEVKVYKNDDFIKSFKTDPRFSALKHGPITMDDTIGNLLKEKEGMDGKKEQYIHDALLAAQKYGLADLPKKAMLELAWVMMHYHMKYEDGVELYGKYVGGWGAGSTTWRFEAIQKNKVVKTVIKGQTTKTHLITHVSNTTLYEGDTYDMASIRMELRDEFDNIVRYNPMPLSLTSEGPIEIVGPHMISLEGGTSGTYIRTTGKTGKASLTIQSETIEPVTISFEIEGKQ